MLLLYFYRGQEFALVVNTLGIDGLRHCWELRAVKCLVVKALI